MYAIRSYYGLPPGADPAALAAAALGLFYQVLDAWADDVEGYGLGKDGMT